MNFELTREQALTLHSAAHFVLEYLDVSDTKRRALDEAQTALRKALGIKQAIAASVTKQAYALDKDKKEWRGFMVYRYGNDAHNDPIPTIDLCVYYDKRQEEVEVTLIFEDTTFQVKDSTEIWEDLFDTDYPEVHLLRPDVMPDLVFFYEFPSWYGSSVQLTINTPTGKKEASFLLTKKGAVSNSDTIDIEVDNQCETKLVK